MKTQELVPFTLVENAVKTGETIIIDGFCFRQCTFTDCTFIHLGGATRIENTTHFIGKTTVRTSMANINAMAIGAMFANQKTWANGGPGNIVFEPHERNNSPDGN